MPFDEARRELAERTRHALAMGGEEKLARRKQQGLLNARERIAYLADPGSFLESGLLATSARPEDADRTPADGKVAGFAKIDGRDVAVVANDFTVMGASSSDTNTRKMGHIKDVATRRGLPIVFLGESAGARMPDVMGARGIGTGDRPTQYQRTRETPWVSAVLGHCYGSSAWYAALSDFVVMRRGAVMAISSVKLTARATSEHTDPEELGGWRVHAAITGLVDQVAGSDEEALDTVKRFLSYLPAHHREPPPVCPVPPDSGSQAHRILELLPESRTRGYEVRRILALVFDTGSLFELKPEFGRPIVTALARLNGKTVGIVASNPSAKGGAIDVDACAKATSFLVLCDSFNIPIVFFVDQPGFLVGVEGERRGAVGRVMNWMNALSLLTVPKISVVMRKTYGQAVLNMGGVGNADEVVCWVTAEVDFMDPRHAVDIVHGVRESDDPARFATLLDQMRRGTSAYDMAALYSAHAVINPVDTRDYLTRILDVHALRLTAGVGEHRLRNWPTSS